MTSRKTPSEPKRRGAAAKKAVARDRGAPKAPADFVRLDIQYGKTLYQRDAATRGASTKAAGVGSLDDIKKCRAIEVVVDGIPLWMPGDELQGLVTTEGTLKRYSRPAQRGLLNDVLTHVRELLFGKAMEALSGHAAEQLCEYLDVGKAVHKGPRLGLWRSSELDLNAERIPKPLKHSKEPILVLLHGFGSTSAGSFGGLLSIEGRASYAALRREYGDRIYAFDHRTVGHDPVRNAQDLIELLPSGQDVHLLCYSRGGIVGDLLCCAPGTRWPRELPRGPHQQAYDDFQLALEERKLNVGRVVRVASPLDGTALASDRLDQWLSYVRFALTKLTTALPVLQQTLDTITTLLALVVEKRLDAERMPGVAAMQPSSPLLRALSAARAVPQTFTVIAGDCVGDGVWRRLKVAITDAFHGTDHDLVVPTASMLAGVRREKPARYYFAQYPGVDHFRYFHLPDTLRRVEHGLLRDDDPTKDGFQRLLDPKQLTANRAARKPRPDAPLTVVLPGIMGSTLAAGKNRIWMDVSSICIGDFSALRIRDHELNAPTPPASSGQIVPEKPLDYWPVNFYGDLIDALERHGDQVLPFAYDWRRPIVHAAALLAEVLRKQWKQGQPLRLLAHSMGGLVVRMLFAGHADLLKRFQSDARNRVLMLGTPNGGSLAVLNAFAGNNDVLLGLDRIAPQNHKQMLEVAASFVGFLELLPQDKPWDPQTLRDLLEASSGPKPRLNAKALDLAIVGRQALQSAADKLPLAQCHYVAGVADPSGENATLVDFAIVNGQLRFKAGPGDGTVPHASGIMSNVDTFYTDALHGDLPRHKKAFGDYIRVLEGRTESGKDAGALKRRADQVRARSRAGVGAGQVDDAGFVNPAARPPGVLLQRSAGEQFYGLFHRGRIDHGMEAQSPQLSVQVVHGDIGLARYPVLVGHYAGQQLQGAEGRLDDVYQGLLRRNIRFGTYPGAIETFAVFGDDDGHRRRRWRTPGLEGVGDDTPPSTVVVGLGQPGELSVGELARTVKRGILAWHGDDAQPGTTKGFSVVLVGVNGSGLTVAECLRGIVCGVLDACDTLRANGLSAPTELDIHEILSDRAHQAAHAIIEIADSHDPIGQRVDAVPHIRENGGLDSVGANLPGGSYSRLDIRWMRDHKLRFALPGVQAALPIHHRHTDWRELEYYAKQSESGADGVGEVLFQQLLPRALKRFALEQYRLVLQLGERSAALPWELVRSDEHAPPLSVSSGMVRQLRDLDYRPLERASEANALVIGDPISALAPLPGAEAEAELVAQRLEEEGYSVTLLLRPTASEVRRALGARRYRILHFAGHGVVNHRGPNGDESERTGLVIGSITMDAPARKKGSIQVAKGANQAEASADAGKAGLTAQVSHEHLLLLGAEDFAETVQVAPEVMFLNCCYAAPFDLPSARRGRPVLAANVGKACIKLGARVVVATGWAVNDDEALRFAEVFYSSLLSGARYFDAVREARASIYPGSSNTYGAYQCYGDPDYTVDNGQGRDKPCVSDREMVFALSNIAVQARGASPQQISTLRLRVTDLIDRHPDYSRNAGVRAAEISTLEELGDYESAIERARQWSSHVDSEMPRELKLRFPILALRAELRANMRVDFELADRSNYVGRQQLVLSSILRRSYLRWHRQRRIVEAKQSLVEHVKLQLSLFDDGLVTDNNSEIASKAFAAAIYARMIGREQRLLNPPDLLDKLRQHCLVQLQQPRTPKSFWSDCDVPNLKLLLWLDAKRPGVAKDPSWNFDNPAMVDVILGDYHFAFKQSATPKERESVLTSVEICCAVLSDFRRVVPADILEREDKLNRLKTELQKML